MKKFFITALFFVGIGLQSGFSQGCMEPSATANGPQIIGYVEAENITNLLGKDASGKDLTENTFAFRRARLGVTGTIPYKFSYYVMGEWSPELQGPHLLDVFFTWKVAKSYLKVSAGQFKTPFGLELSTPCQSLYTIDRSQVVNELASPFRDQGIMVSGSSDSLKLFGIEKPNIFTYSLALTNGTGLNTKDNNKSKDFIGRVVFAPCNFFQVGGSYHHGKGKNPDPAVTKEDVLTRWGADLQLKKTVGRYSILSQSEYIYGKDEGSKLVGGGCGVTPEVVQGSFKRNGFYSQLMVRTPWKLEPVAKIQVYDPNADVADDDKKEYKKTSWIFGFNYYVNDWTRIQLNYLYNMEGSSATDLARFNEYKNDMFIVQLQFILK